MTPTPHTPTTALRPPPLTHAAQRLHEECRDRFGPPLAEWRWLEVDKPVSLPERPATRESIARLANGWWHDHAAPLPLDEVADRLEPLATVCAAYANVTGGELSWLLYCVRQPSAEAAGTAFWSRCLGRLRSERTKAEAGR